MLKLSVQVGTTVLYGFFFRIFDIGSPYYFSVLLWMSDEFVNVNNLNLRSWRMHSVLRKARRHYITTVPAQLLLPDVCATYARIGCCRRGGWCACGGNTNLPHLQICNFELRHIWFVKVPISFLVFLLNYLTITIIWGSISEARVLSLLIPPPP